MIFNYSSKKCAQIFVNIDNLVQQSNNVINVYNMSK